MKMKRLGQAGLVILATLVLIVLAKHYERRYEEQYNFNEIIISSGILPDITISHEEELVIPGLEGEYEFLVLADMHLVIKTREDAGAYGVSADERINYFSNSKGVPSSEHLPQWVAYANEEKFDAVLMVGDMIDYYTEETVNYLYEEIAKLEVPYVFTMGNHELFSPWYESVPAESKIYELFSVDKNIAFQAFEYEEFTVCVIDNNEYQVNPMSYDVMKAYLEENAEKPVILLAHVPFYTENDKTLLEKSVSTWGQALVIGEGEGTRDTTSVSRDFLSMILADESPVVAIFTGDNHFYHKGKLTDGVIQWVIEPSFTGNGMILEVKGE